MGYIYLSVFIIFDALNYFYYYYFLTEIKKKNRYKNWGNKNVRILKTGN